MELPAGVNRRYASVAAIALVALWCWVAFDRPYRFPSHISWNIYSNRPQTPPTIDVFDFPPVESAAIERVCANTDFNDTITFVCDEPGGDVVEIRNSILTCVRYAIAAGANLLIPRIIMREDYVDEHAGNVTTFDYLFDTAHFVHSMDNVCSGMHLYGTADESTYKPISLVAESLARSSGKTTSKEWNVAFYKWLGEKIAPSKRPSIIEISQSFLKYPISDDDEEFDRTFGKILKFAPDARNLASTTLLKLSETVAIPRDMSQPILSNIFLGVHFSTLQKADEIDKANFHYGTQSKLYLEQASQLGLDTIYASSDDETDIAQFARDAQSMSIKVTSKFDLLKGGDRETLLRLTPDQQAMVDFLVLSKASQFVGVGHSGFAWNIALQRHQFAPQENYLEGPQMLNDQLSQIYGTPKARPEFAASMWP
ncbi:hypothetical protein G7Y89_g15097 [Cudoniella acicularis]|uniref:Alternative oxidase n=1 Tax=Cudoniella acicularis TaxID=354080 RepID=A0A8H4VP20_9HELO|nr:hypothetical protein G7Y89_g15097 [Cudoniella acicularis]